jgi:hypothetical protein
MKKLLFVVPLLLASIVSFASQPQPQNKPAEKNMVTTSTVVSEIKIDGTDWLLICNEKGDYWYPDGRDCISVIWNCDSGHGYSSDCP